MKKGWIIAAIVLIVVGALVFAGAFMASGFDITKLGAAEYDTKTYTAEGDFSAIDVSTDVTDLILKKAGDGKLSVVCFDETRVEYPVTIESGILKIIRVDGRKWYERWTLFGKSRSVTVYLPGSEYERLTVSAGTGEVTVPDGFTFGSAEIKASTGDIGFGADVTGKLRITAGTGDIKLDRADIGEAELSVSTGKISVSSVVCEGGFSVGVGTGKTNLTDLRCKSLTSDGSTGDITLKNVIVSEKLSVERGTGDVSFDGCDAAEMSVKTSTGSVTGTLLSEKVFIVRTSTGRISVPDTVSGGRCEITTSTGRIEIKLK